MYYRSLSATRPSESLEESAQSSCSMHITKKNSINTYLTSCILSDETVMRCKSVDYVLMCSFVGQSVFQSMSLELQLGEERICHYETISLVCKHPDLNAKRGDGQYQFTTSTPVWKQDGEIITVDSDVYSINDTNRTHTHLIIVAPDGMNSNTSLTFTCFVTTAKGTAVHSNSVTVYPGLSECICNSLYIAESATV